MVDDKVEMNNDTGDFTSSNNSDPKNAQELTQYKSKSIFTTSDYIKNIEDARELAQYVQSLLQTIQDKFQNMSDQILTRIDEMGNRIDDLEKNIGDLMTQAGVEGADK